MSEQPIKPSILKEVSIGFTWTHPKNNCPVKTSTITVLIMGTGDTIEEANKHARVLAENSPKICDGCGQNYKLQG